MTEKSGLGYCDAHWRVVHPQRLRRLLGSVRGTSTPVGKRISNRGKAF
jgi:hypothetical protein